MSILGHNWLSEGYYEEDSWGDLSRIEEKDKIIEARKSGILFRSDGYSTSKVDDSEEILDL